MSASDWIAIFAGIVAIASVIVSIQQSHLTRKHNRLSLKPLLSIYRAEFDNHPLEITLVNKGLGPAILKSFSVWVDDVEISKGTINPIYAALNQVGISISGVGGHLFSKDEVLPPSEKISIFMIPLPENKNSTYDERVKAFRRIKFKIKFQSIYDESFEYYGNG